MWRNNRQSTKTSCNICIILWSRLKMALKCSTFTTCSQLICPKHAFPFYIPQPLQLKKKHLAVTSPLLTPIISCLSFIFPLPPTSSAYFRYAISFLSFSCVAGRASVHLIKMYIFKSFFKGELFA